MENYMHTPLNQAAVLQLLCRFTWHIRRNSSLKQAETLSYSTISA